MLAHADDRGLQLGWSVFDTCNVERGRIYGLDFHIDRFYGSMALAKITPSATKPELHEIVSATVAAGIAAAQVEPEAAHGLVRFWASAGLGGTDNSAGPQPRDPVPATIFCKVSYLRSFKDECNFHRFLDAFPTVLRLSQVYCDAQGRLQAVLLRRTAGVKQ